MNRDELLDAVAETPNDDGPRMVFADWLLQQPGELDRTRGEYISLACSTQRSPKRSARLKELLDKYEAAWLGPLDGVIERTARQWSRGFLEACSMRHRDTISIEPVLGNEVWRTLRTLELVHTSLDTGAQLQLLSQRGLTNLRTLHMYQSVVEAVATSAIVPRISELALFPSGPPLADTIPLLEAPCFAGLRKLHVHGAARLACAIARPGLTLIAVQGPSSLGSWLIELEQRRSTFDEVRLVSGVHVLVARGGLELVIRPSAAGRWSALEIRWTDEPMGGLRNTVITAVGRLPQNTITHLTFVGPPKSHFDVARWKQRITTALVPNQPGLQVG